MDSTIDSTHPRKRRASEEIVSGGDDWWLSKEYEVRRTKGLLGVIVHYACLFIAGSFIMRFIHFTVE